VVQLRSEFAIFPCDSNENALSETLILEAYSMNVSQHRYTYTNIYSLKTCFSELIHI